MTSSRYFYLFKGYWIDHYDELKEMLDSPEQKISFWEPKDKNKEFTLLILYNTSLSDSFCYRRDIWKSDEEVFNSFYKNNQNNFIIHYYNEFSEKENLRNVSEEPIKEKASLQ